MKRLGLVLCLLLTGCADTGERNFRAKIHSVKDNSNVTRVIVDLPAGNCSVGLYNVNDIDKFSQCLQTVINDLQTIKKEMKAEQ